MVCAALLLRHGGGRLSGPKWVKFDTGKMKFWAKRAEKGGKRKFDKHPVLVLRGKSKWFAQHFF